MMLYLRDLSILTCCTLAAALSTACKSDGSGSATDTDTSATAETQGSTAGPTGDPTSDTATSTASMTGTGTGTGTGTTDTPTTDTPTSDPTATTAATDDSTTGAPVCPYTPVEGSPKVALELLASGFDRPVLALAHPKQQDRLFIVEQGGHIKILEPGQTSAPPDDQDFLFVAVKNANATTIGAEQGLLGLAFHPDFPDDPRVYINYNPAEANGPGPTYVAEYKLDPNNPDRVDPATRRLVYAVGQPASNHNGGNIVFGADRMLYIGMGDGGGKDNQYGAARDFLSPLAKILRIDVEPDGTADSNKACDACPMVDSFDFTVPADNPHVGDNEYAPEVYAAGMRNPWRFQFDPANGDLYVADVGQNTWEEVSIVNAGQDYGWDSMEANHCFAGNQCDTSAGPNQVNQNGLTAPITEYEHSGGRCSVTGVGIYHSCEVPAWDGVYFYADYCSTELLALKWDGNTAEELGVVATLGEPVIGSGHNSIGDVYVTTVVVDALNNLQDGKVYRIAPGN